MGNKFKNKKFEKFGKLFGNKEEESSMDESVRINNDRVKKLKKEKEEKKSSRFSNLKKSIFG